MRGNKKMRRNQIPWNSQEGAWSTKTRQWPQMNMATGVRSGEGKEYTKAYSLKNKNALR